MPHVTKEIKIFTRQIFALVSLANPESKIRLDQGFLNYGFVHCEYTSGLWKQNLEIYV